MKSRRLLDKVLKIGLNGNCCGCTTCRELCPKNAIEILPNNKGFLYPTVNQDCVNCGICEKFCPLMTEKVNDYDQHYYAAKRKNDELRKLSQSGGAFSVFAEDVLKQSGVVYGVSLNKDLMAVYSRVDNISQLQKLRGSKYVQASVGNIFSSVKQDLINEKLVLFSGTPCHVHGLILFLRAGKVDTKNLITVDIICHGVVSPLVFRDYKENTEKRYKKRVRDFNFRDKQFGWHGCHTNAKIGMFNYISDDYVNIFYSDLALRDCCFECRYTNLQRVGDITVGDCWGIENNKKEFDDNKGVSLIIINSKKGEDLFLTNKSEFISFSVDIKDYLQPNLAAPTPKPKDLSDFWEDYSTFGFEYAAFKYCSFSPQKDYVLLKRNDYIKRVIRKINKVI